MIEIVRLLFRWLHIFPAAILLGGVLLMRLSVWPSLANLAEEERTRFLDAIRRRWAMWVGISAALLLISGIVNTVLVVKYSEFGDATGLYHGMLGLKILLALAIIYIASMLAGRSDAADRFRQRTPLWLNVNLLLAILLICVAGYMRLVDRTPKGAEPRDAAPNMIGD
jgi:uncharacterized membrane protein